MAGIYGDMLLAFPEQFITITVYSQTANYNAGWIPGNDQRQVRGIIQNTSGNRIKDNNGNLARSGGEEFWTGEANLAGLFTQIDGDVYRLVSDNKWKTEGGFFRYSLEKVVGNDGTESANPAWNTGGHNFG